VGNSALYYNTTGSQNTAVGSGAVMSNTTGASNTAVGADALRYNTTGFENTAVGHGAVTGNTTGAYNTAVGTSALKGNSTGVFNTAFGYAGLRFNSTGTSNTAVGALALFSSPNGTGNTALGTDALYNLTTGGFNIAIGASAGINLTTGGNNIYLGHPGSSTESQTIRLGDPATHTRTFLAGNVGLGTENPVAKLDVVGTVQAATVAITSDIRLKTNITPLTNVLEKLTQLRGVSFEWNDEYKALGRGTGRREIGVIAQDVEAVFPELVTTWGEGYKAVDYGKLSGVLIEAIKELQANTEAQFATKEARIAALETRLAAVEGRLVALEGTIAAAGHAAERRGAPVQWSAVGVLSGGPLVGGLLLAGLVFGRNRDRESQR
jgi:hypothetical protein